MNRVRKVLWLALAVLVLALLAGCGPSQIRLGWVASDRIGHFSARYTLFTGHEARTVRIDAKEMLTLSYDVQVARGVLVIGVEEPDNQVLWAVVLDGDAGDMVRLPVERAGRYSIVVRGDGTGGGCKLSWEVG